MSDKEESFLTFDLSKLKNVEITENKISSDKKPVSDNIEIELKILDNKIYSEIESNFNIISKEENKVRINADNFYFLNWIKRNLQYIEVLEPSHIRKTIKDFATAISNRYAKTDDNQFIHLYSDATKGSLSIEGNISEENINDYDSEFLHLNSEDFQNCDFLAEYKNLKDLRLFNSKIKNLNIFRDDWEILYLILSGTEITDFSFLKAKQYNSLEMLEIVSDIDNVTFDFNYITSKNLERLKIKSEKLYGFEKLKDLVFMRDLTLTWNNCENMYKNYDDIFENLPKKSLITNMKIKTPDDISIEKLDSLPNLMKLDLKYGAITDIFRLDYMQSLQILSIETDEIDLSFFCHSNLSKLIIRADNIKNISSIAKLKNLIYLDISGYTDEDYSFLYSLKNLTHLKVDIVEDKSELLSAIKINYNHPLAQAMFTRSRINKIPESYKDNVASFMKKEDKLSYIFVSFMA